MRLKIICTNSVRKGDYNILYIAQSHNIGHSLTWHTMHRCKDNVSQRNSPIMEVPL